MSYDKRGEILSYRSYTSELPESQLLLFDGLALAGPQPQSFLFDRNLSDSLNIDRSHHLSDEEVLLTINTLLKTGLFIREDNVVSLSALGGILWESERHPVWRRYAISGVDASTSRFQVLCVDRCIGDMLMKYAAAKWFAENSFSHVEYEICEWTPRYWDPIRPCYCLSNPVTYDPSSLYEQDTSIEPNIERTWWENLYELQRFLHEDSGCEKGGVGVKSRSRQASP